MKVWLCLSLLSILPFSVSVSSLSVSLSLSPSLLTHSFEKLNVLYPCLKVRTQLKSLIKKPISTL